MEVHRHNVLGLFLISVLILTFSVSVFSQDAEGVQIVNGRDGVGPSQSIPVGIFQVDGRQLSANVSVKVSKGYFVQFCAQKDGTGRCEALGEGVHNLSWVEFNFIQVGKGDPPSGSGKVAAPGASASSTANNAGATPAASGVAPATIFEQKN